MAKSEGLFEIDYLSEYKAEFGFEINTASEQEQGVSQWDLSSDEIVISRLLFRMDGCPMIS